MRTLYVTGGRQRVRLLKTEEEWNLYDKALILRVEAEMDRCDVCVDYQSPPDVCTADGTPSFLFKTGTLRGNIFYACTSTEVLIYRVPQFERIGYVSLPCFNDLHHVVPGEKGNLLAANTGLDMVVEFTQEGKVLRDWSVLGGDPWGSFSREIDYRRVATTKPHKSHPNHVFEIGGDIWVTRGQQGDAVCLTRPDHRIALSSVGVHDGHLHHGRLYFTTVDGTIVIADPQTLQTVETVDLKAIDNGSKALLGWCRGLSIESATRIWVGFTRIRKTKFKENVNWVKHVFHEMEKPTRIALYDLATKECIREIDLEKQGLNVLFSIHPATPNS
jgi:hypothetical protein